MKPRDLSGAVAVCCVMFFALALSLSAQEIAPRHTGAPQDWSQSHIVFSRDALARHPELMDQEPRIRQQMMERWQAPDWGAFAAAGLTNLPPRHGLGRDWSVTTLGAHLRINVFPAKFSFDPSAPPDCTNDYVVFALAVAGVTGGQANLVAFNNLYVNALGTGLCSGLTAPTVLFAYNVTTAAGGQIQTSPVLSLDGTKIAFVETVPGGVGPAIFHVLTWTAGQGSLVSAAAPASMTSLTFSPAAGSSMSSPWVDYTGDTAYVGTNKGNVYQIAPVFHGTPALGGSPWPVFTANYILTAPVLDSARGFLMVGSGNGDLYQIDTTTGAVGTLVIGAAGGTSSGILAPPIVDITNGTTFVVNPNNGSSAVLEEVDTSTLLPISTASIGVGATGGIKVHLYQPAFSNAYFTSPSTGVVSLCGTGAGTIVDTITAVSITTNVLTVTANNSFTVGEQVTIQGTTEGFLNGQVVTVASLIGTAPTYTGFTANFTHADYSNPSDTGTVSGGDTTPWQYTFGFIGRTMNASPASSRQLSTDPTDRCTGWTEFFNPYAGVVDNIVYTSITSNVLTVIATNNFTVGEQVYFQGTKESFLNGQSVIVTALIGSGPSAGFIANFTAANYGDPTDTGTVSAGTDLFFFGLTGDCTGLGGLSTTGCVVALSNNAGATATTTAAVAGGPSGIVVDNYSTAAQASSIYLTSLTQDTSYKFTQAGLQ